jgi:hypothetical protein
MLASWSPIAKVGVDLGDGDGLRPVGLTGAGGGLLEGGQGPVAGAGRGGGGHTVSLRLASISATVHRWQ